jgi:hypothetical protein
LKDNYPAVHRIVGSEFFRAMAVQFVTANPPHSPVMLGYGAGFAKFIARFEPAATLPYLPDVAQIERAWIEAYHAADAEVLAARDLLAIDQRRLAEVRLMLHPSLRMAQSQFPALTIWRMNIDGAEPASIDHEAGGEDALIIRSGMEVEVYQLPAGGATFIKALGGGKPVVGAAIAALETTPHFDLEDLVSRLVEAGAFIDWKLDHPSDTSGGRQ